MRRKFLTYSNCARLLRPPQFDYRYTGRKNKRFKRSEPFSMPRVQKPEIARRANWLNWMKDSTSGLWKCQRMLKCYESFGTLMNAFSSCAGSPWILPCGRKHKVNIGR